MWSRVAVILKDFSDLIYPDYCVACRDFLVSGEDMLCARCLHELPQTQYHLWPQNNETARKFDGRVAIAHTLALYKYDRAGKVQQVLHALKYRGEERISYRLGRYYGHILAPYFTDVFDVVTPVPLHREKLQTRGYNQVTGFAQELAHALSVVFDADLLVRRQVQQGSQTKLHRVDRWENVKASYAVADGAAVAGKHVLLADDVITTGATVEACAFHLLQAGAKAVSVVAMAATQRQMS